MTARLIFAEAADADGRAFGDFGDEVNRLSAGGIGEKFALVAIKELFAFSHFFRIEFENLRDEFSFRCEGGKPDVEVAVHCPAVFWNSARRVAGDTDAQALLWRRPCADLEGAEVEFLHGAYPFARNHSIADRIAG